MFLHCMAGFVLMRMSGLFVFSILMKSPNYNIFLLLRLPLKTVNPDFLADMIF